MNRDRFPSLSNDAARFDGPAGSQVVDAAAIAMADYLVSPVANAHGGFEASDRTDAIVEAARNAVTELLDAEDAVVVLGGSMTSLVQHLVTAVGPTIASGDRVLGTRLDHEANVSPWERLASARGAEFHLVEPDPASLAIGPEHVEPLLEGRPRWLAITAASNACGSIPDLEPIIELCHEHGCRVLVDAVHAAPHMRVSMRELGADGLVVSAYKWFGPHGSALMLAKDLAEELNPGPVRGWYAQAPEAWERGALPFEQLVGMTAAARYVLDTGMDRIHEHETQLLQRLLDGLSAIPGVRTYGSPPRRTATVLLTVDGVAAATVARELAERSLYVWHGHFLAIRLMEFLELDAAVRVGLLHYNNEQEVDALVHALGEIAASAQEDGRYVPA